jgi:hypothetical protein
MGESRGAYRILMGKLREEDHFIDSGVDGRIILKWILQKWNGVHGLDRPGSGKGQVANFFECGGETSGCINEGDFLST